MANKYIESLYDEVFNTLKMNNKKVPLKVIEDKSKGFYGQISLISERVNGKRIRTPLNITINTYYFKNISRTEKAYHYIYKQGWSLEECILETICHEIAHMSYIGHNKSHTTLTRTYFNMVKAARENNSPVISVAANNVFNTLKELCVNINLDEKRARRILRSSNIPKPGKTWTWEHGIPQEVIELLKNK